MLIKKQKLVPVILCGGIGSRLWPLSRQDFPKQFRALLSEESMLIETIKRVSDKKKFHSPIIMCSSEHRFLVAEQLRQAKIENAQIILEPTPMNTGPAITVACELIAQQHAEANALILPSDHTISNIDAFNAAIQKGLSAARNDLIVTFGIQPTHPETGYGYIKVGQPSGIPEIYHIDTFTEKPNASIAQSYLTKGGHLWNSGMFLFKISTFLDEMTEHAPDIRNACNNALNEASHDLDFLRLNSSSFSSSPKEAIDTALIEKSTKTAVVPVSMGWSDVGSWNTLWNLGDKDLNENVLVGNVFTETSRRCYIRSDNKLVAVFGVENLIIVNVEDTILVMHKDKAQNLSEFVNQLEASGKSDAVSSLIGYRPWGYYREIDQEIGFKVKRIVVKPGGCLSRQMHHHRSEHWVVVEGIAKVLKDKEEFILKANQSTYIPAEIQHRLENIGDIPLHVIEVQTGQYLEEDDIIRFEDIYKRC